MRPVKKFFLDTYAILEYLRGNAEYLNRMSGAELATSLLNLMELYYVFLRDHGEKAAESVYSTYRHYQAEIIDEDVRSGMALKLRMKIEESWSLIRGRARLCHRRAVADEVPDGGRCFQGPAER
ncbi:MAG: type II toxin-antitoxin system VapC family toxin [Thaumarchaeota archaeon]|nr:MAG: type II toxin-antitoxin system VapC family toxin [Nitrososphaerota archaeon]